MLKRGGDIGNVVCDFLETVVHQVVFVRKLYDSRVFEEKREYGTVVSKSRHPGLNEYIYDVVHSLKPSIENGNLQSMDIVFFNSDLKPFDKVSLAFKELSIKDVDIDALDVLETLFRNVLAKLSLLDALAKPLPDGCTFEILARTASRDAIQRDMWYEEVAKDVALEPGMVCSNVKSIETNGISLHVAMFQNST